MSISSETLHKNLKDIFGFNSFKGKQEQIIQNLLIQVLVTEVENLY